MHIVAMVTAWQRPAVTRCCYRALSRVELPPGWRLDVQIAGSEGDVSRAMADEFGFRYLETDNRPLSQKHNRMVQATRDLGWDYLWLLGSDSIVSPSILREIYGPALADHPAWCGLRDLYFFADGVLWYWPGYESVASLTNKRPRPDSLGAGRMFSRATVEAANWELWKPHINRGLDWNCFLRLNALGAPETHLRHWQPDRAPSSAKLIELRSELQITNWRYFEINCQPLRCVDVDAEAAAMLAGWVT